MSWLCSLGSLLISFRCCCNKLVASSKVAFPSPCSSCRNRSNPSAPIFPFSAYLSNVSLTKFSFAAAILLFFLRCNNGVHILFNPTHIHPHWNSNSGPLLQQQQQQQRKHQKPLTSELFLPIPVNSCTPSNPSCTTGTLVELPIYCTTKNTRNCAKSPWWRMTSLSRRVRSVYPEIVKKCEKQSDQIKFEFFWVLPSRISQPN